MARKDLLPPQWRVQQVATHAAPAEAASNSAAERLASAEGDEARDGPADTGLSSRDELQPGGGGGDALERSAAEGASNGHAQGAHASEAAGSGAAGVPSAYAECFMTAAERTAT